MVTEVAEDIFLIPVPLPNNKMRRVNSYLVRGTERSLLIDTGFNDKECKKALLEGMRDVGVNVRNVDVFATHLHPDHSGLFEWFSQAGAMTFCHFDSLERTARQEAEIWLGLVGDENGNLCETDETLVDTGDELPTLVSLGDGDFLEVGRHRFRCIQTPGHHYSHMCLYEPSRKILFSGDHVLMGLSPSVGCVAGDRNPLRDYLDSLDKVRELDVEMTLPGHRRPFGNPRERIDELKVHHEERLEEMLCLLGDGVEDALSLATRMRWSNGRMKWSAMRPYAKASAISETLAHLVFLESKGAVSLEWGTRGFVDICAVR